MNTTIWKAAAMIAVLAAVPCGVADAAIENGDNITIDRWDQRHSGQSQGPFEVQVIEDTDIDPDVDGLTVGSLDGAAFLTFCVERFENFSPGNTYNIAGSSNASQNQGHTLSGYAAFVFQTFTLYDFDTLVGDLDTFNGGVAYTPGGIAGVNDTSHTWGEAMNAFQGAIWAGMINLSKSGGDINVGDIGVNGTIAEQGYDMDAAILDDLGIDLDSFFASGWGGYSIGDPGITNAADLQYAMLNDLNDTSTVEVLNLTTLSGGTVQDQVYLTDTSTTPQSEDVPEPGSFAVIFGLLCCAAGYHRWKGSPCLC